MSTANWIKLRVNVWDKAEVQYLAESCEIPTEYAVGILCKLWTWFDQHTAEGVTNKFGTKMIEKYTRISVTKECDEVVTSVTGVKIIVTPFLKAMQEVEWIFLTEDGFWSLINWGEHNGETAKKRAGSQKRQEKSRSNKKKTPSVTQVCDEGVTREEKRREEKRIEENIESVGSLEVYEDFESQTPTHTNNGFTYLDSFPKTAKEVEDHALIRLGKFKPYPDRCIEFFEQWSACDWMDANQKQINWKQKLMYFLKDYQVKPKEEDPNQGNRDFINKFYGENNNVTAIN